VKKAVALVHVELGVLEAAKGGAIVAAADEVLAGRWDGEFPLVVWQTGSGTQTNMNVNEVLANRASEILGGERGERRLVHPNDDVNRGQSTNDAFPTAIHVARSRRSAGQVVPAVARLRDTLSAKAEAFDGHREDRPHPPHGRDARSPSGRRSRAGRPSSTTALGGSSRRCPASSSWPWAGPRSAPA
jgi:fumarate hydratase class II